ncbi:MAG TPA: FKBP-type peptidyl-prolyl cis-trans isomerase [Cyclobacteriaceae bacterium]|nr:FKBP-type peptidyl-prolyl cis-trans isomerase [Cyclobacteriaceae bacterium]
MNFNKIAIGLVLVVMACSSNERETPKGIKFTMVREGEGRMGQPGEYVNLNLIFKDENDSIWNDSRSLPFPMILQLREESQNNPGFEEIVHMLKEGDSVTFQLTAKSLFEDTWEQPIPEGMDPESKFTFYMGVAEVMSDLRIREMEQEYIEKLNAEQMVIDGKKIDEYLAASNIEAQKTESGLRYIITKEGTGDPVAVGNEVSIDYAGYLLDGTLFDTSIEAVAKKENSSSTGKAFGPLTLQAGSGQVIKGWEEAVLLMKKGTKMRVWIPSPLAYGPQARSAIIKPNSILVFDMEMIDIKR